jgi:proline iminopeptidase
MGEKRPLLKRLAVVLAVGLGGYGQVVRPRLLRWGATGEEASRTFPGDELVPYPDGQTTMATTLPARPEEVWAWLQQMGCDRAGWYSWDRLDNGGRPSARRIVPEWQDLREGRHLDSLPNGKAWFTAALVDPPRSLVLRADLKLPSCASFDPQHWPLPPAYSGGIWAFHLEAAPDRQTRLIVRTRGRGRPRPLMWAVDRLISEPTHFFMQNHQFRNLRARVGPDHRNHHLWHHAHPDGHR